MSQEQLTSMIQNVRTKNGSTASRSGLKYKKNEPRFMIDDKLIQRTACETALDALGDKAWLYCNNKGHKCRKLKEVFESVVVPKVGYDRLTYSTFWKWFKHYLQFGETQADQRKREQTRRRRRKASYYSSRVKSSTFSDQDDSMLRSIMDNQPQLYLDEIQTLMSRRRRKIWSTSSIWKRMNHLGYSLQKAVFQARQRNEQKRNQYMQSLKMMLRNPDQLLFIDETHRSVNASRRRRGWGKRSHPPVIESTFEEEFRKRYTLIGACDINGFVVSACKIVERERSRVDNDPERGTVDMNRFEDYIINNVVPVLGRFDLGEPRSLVVMDNAAIHISDTVVESIEQAGAKILYSAPYSPDLNPIEFMFSVYKAGLKRRSHNRCFNWKDSHYLSMKDVTPFKARQFYKKCNVPGISIVQSESDDDEIFDFVMAHQHQMNNLIAAYLWSRSNNIQSESNS